MADRDPFRLSLRAKLYLRTSKYRRYKYETFSDYAERMWTKAVCRILGHVPRRKFSCTICDRCRMVIG